MKYSVRSTFACLFVLAITVASDQNEDTWEEPDAWYSERHDLSDYDSEHSLTVVKNTEKNECGQCLVPDNTLAFIYLRKFVRNLFSRKKLKFTENAVYERAILFTVSPEQLELLEKLDDPRDLDAVLTEIFTKTRTPSGTDHFTANEKSKWTIPTLLWDIIKDLAQLLKTPEIRFLLIAAGILLLFWYFHKYYKISFFVIILVSVLAFGYFYTYLECNRKLEVELMLEKMQPQTDEPAYTPRWLKSIFNYFGNSPKQSRQEYINKASELRLGFCRPDYVFMLYVNDLILQNIQMFFEKCTNTFISIKNALPFPFNYLSAVLLVFLVAYMLKLTFKYILSPRAWASLWQNHHYHQQQQRVHAQPPPSIAHTEDRLSGENLKTLLDILKNPTIVMHSSADKVPKVPAPSGVQEILEKLEKSSDNEKSFVSNSADALEKNEGESKTNDTSFKSKSEDCGDAAELRNKVNGESTKL